MSRELHGCFALSRYYCRGLKSDSFQSEDGTASTSAIEECDDINPPSSETDDPPSTEMPELSGDCPSDVPRPSEDANVDFDPEAATRIYAQEWVESLHRDSLQSVSIRLWYLLVGELHYPIMNAAGLIGDLLGKGERTVREWRS